MESLLISTWQVSILCGILTWIVVSWAFNFTRIIRSITQPWVSSCVISGTSVILQIQKYQHRFLDALFIGLSCVVSVPFYTGFLPLLFWSGHGKLARQMTLLMAFCDYTGNCIKDVVSAPRPKSPPVRILTVTEDEKENAMEYGLPSSHTLNTVCLSGYLLHYIFSYNENSVASIQLAAFAFVCLFVALIGLGRIYLGMHSVVDIIGGLMFGLAILGFWVCIHEYVDNFVVSGQNVTTFWVALSLLLLFAYPTPELPTPSFEYHTAFTGVALGIVTGVQQTYDHFHHEHVARVFTPELPMANFAGRILVGIPTILLVKFCSKALAKWILPITANALGISIKSSGYVPALTTSSTVKQSNGYLLALVPQVADLVASRGIPVIAAGGIVDARGYVAALALGAQGVCLGTRFLATEESNAHPLYKSKLVEMRETEYTDVFGRARWPDAPHRVLKTPFFMEWRNLPSHENEANQKVIGHSTIHGMEKDIRQFAGTVPNKSATGDIESMCMYAGEGVGLIKDIIPAAQVVKRLVEGGKFPVILCLIGSTKILRTTFHL